MNTFENAGVTDKFPEDMVRLAVEDPFNDPVLTVNCFEEATEYLIDLLGIEMAVAMRMVWDRQDEVREELACGQA
jgi:hypothetical protein